MRIVDTEVLKTKPLFDKSNPANSALFASGQVSTLPTDMRERLLANEIPALTFAVGHRGVGGFNTRNIDIRDKYLVKNKVNNVSAPWPRGTGDRYEWRHSDFINVAYPYLYKLFDEFKNISQPVPGGGI